MASNIRGSCSRFLSIVQTVASKYYYTKYVKFQQYNLLFINPIFTAITNFPVSNYCPSYIKGTSSAANFTSQSASCRSYQEHKSRQDSPSLPPFGPKQVALSAQGALIWPDSKKYFSLPQKSEAGTPHKYTQTRDEARGKWKLFLILVLVEITRTKQRFSGLLLLGQFILETEPVFNISYL